MLCYLTSLPLCKQFIFFNLDCCPQPISSSSPETRVHQQLLADISLWLYEEQTYLPALQKDEVESSTYLGNFYISQAPLQADVGQINSSLKSRGHAEASCTWATFELCWQASAGSTYRTAQTHELDLNALQARALCTTYPIILHMSLTHHTQIRILSLSQN